MNAQLLEEGRISAAKFGLNGKLGSKKIIDIAEEMVRISSLGLQRRNKLDERGVDERQFLDPLYNIIKNKKTGSEILLEKFNSIWEKNIDKVFINNAF
jgi:glutamate--cysteine ligase